MGALQGGGHVVDIGDDPLEGNARACRVLRSQGATDGIVHDQKGHAVQDGIIEHAHNMGVVQPGQRLRFVQELGGILLVQAQVQDFECGRLLEIDMLAQIDVGEAATS